MKRKIILSMSGVLVALLSFLGVPAYAGGHGGGAGGHGGFSGGGHAGFSGGARAGGGGAAYGRAGNYGGRYYSPGISTGRSGNHSGYGQRYYTPRTSTAGQMYSSSARSQARTRSSGFTRAPNYSGSYYIRPNKSGAGIARKPATQSRYYSGTSRGLRQQPGVTTAKGATQSGRNWSKQNPSKQRLDRQTTDRLRNWQGKTPGWNDAKHNNSEHWRDRHHHGHDWWHNHCQAIVLVGWGYWGWDDGWWYPAWGYDPYYSYYDYYSPIYGYDGLRPDEVIANVQAALQQMGYYVYAVDGVLGPATEAAIADYQRDRGLPVTGAIDPATVRSLGLSS